MNPTRILSLALLAAGAADTKLAAQDPAAPSAAEKPAEPPGTQKTEMEKWLATTDAQWQATFNRDVVDAHAAELKKLAAQYGVSLEAALTKATAAGDLDGAVALRNEQKRFSETNFVPEQDDATDAATLMQIRAATRVQLAKIEQENAARTKALHAKYDATLAQVQQQLTQAKRLDDALLVKAKREEVTAAWLAGLPAAPAASAAVAVAGQPKPPLPSPGRKVAANPGSEADKLTAYESRMTGSKWTFPWTGGPQHIRLEENGKLVLGWAPTIPRTWKVVRDGVIEIFPYSNQALGETVEAHGSARSGTLIRDGKRHNIRRLD